MKKYHYFIITVILAYILMELSASFGLYVLNKYFDSRYEPADVLSAKHSDIIRNLIDQKTNYLSFSPTLGWTIKKHGSSELYQANSYGIRSDKEYAITPPDGIRRVSTFGDSFTHCDDVRNNETWQAIMERDDSNIEVLNFGVGGYGLDQAYLRYLEDGRQHKPHIVLIGFMSENIYRNVNTYRPFYFPKTGVPLTKPRFVIKDGELSLIQNPMKSLDDYKYFLSNAKSILPKIGENDDYYKYKKYYRSNTIDFSPTVKIFKLLINGVNNKLENDKIIINNKYNENSDALNVTKKIFDEFYKSATNNNSLPIIIIFPEKGDVIRYKDKKDKQYSNLLSYFESKGYRYIDLIDAFNDMNTEDLFKGHYSPLANKLVAQYILDYLNNMNNPEN